MEAQRIEALPQLAPPEPGSKPLREPEREAYARARAMLLPKETAYRRALEQRPGRPRRRGNRQPVRPESIQARAEGDLSPHGIRAQLSKWERDGKIVARIAWLTRQEEDIIREKRRRIEEFLWSVHELNYADYFETVQISILDDDGEPTGETRSMQQMRPFDQLSEDQQRMIVSLRYTEKGRAILEVFSKMTANIELRKMLGIGKTDGGDPSAVAIANSAVVMQVVTNIPRAPDEPVNG